MMIERVVLVEIRAAMPGIERPAVVIGEGGCVRGNRQAVQHQTGGTVQELLVRDGDVVKKGQVLVRMNPITAQSAYEVAEASYLSALANVARLTAERDGLKTIKFPEELEKRRAEPRVSELMTLQNQLLMSRQSSLQNEMAVPDAPARAVRPIRWTYASGTFGRS